MMRIVLAVTALALGISTAFADDPIATRKALMKENGKQAGYGTKVMKGEEPFDLAKAKAIFASYENAAAKAPALFPDDSKTGGDTAALPAVWEHKDDFDAKLKKLGEDAKAAEAKVVDEASFKATFPAVQKNCGGCHETYRLKKQN
ncbi:MAG TPA: cytochrome c [Xanthobacteraceae bacterium]|nr:cytochrome c [Xanthobacteraceae bacterium]